MTSFADALPRVTAAAGWLSLAACAADEPAGRSFTVRDSAGIEIVETVAARGEAVPRVAIGRADLELRRRIHRA